MSGLNSIVAVYVFTLELTGGCKLWENYRGDSKYAIVCASTEVASWLPTGEGK